MTTQNLLLNSRLTSEILGSCFDVVNELGMGFLESVYKNALLLALTEKKLLVETEKSFTVYFKNQKVGLYKADIVVENSVVVELKCCKSLLPEHQAQVINYLAASKLPVGLLINFYRTKLDYKRLYNPTLEGVNMALSEIDSPHVINFTNCSLK